MNKLKGFLQSGVIFVGDPVYMSGSTREEVAPDPHNPFRNWDVFSQELDGQDLNLTLPGAYNDGSTGRGCALQVGRLSGQYEIVKEYDEQGRVSQIIIKFHD